jgi:1-phosphofructokinase family hexose kinase
MILTVNLNPALDRVIFIPRFLPEGTARTTRMVDSVGGKGLDASVTLQCLGAPNFALSFMAGRVGETLAELIDNYNIQNELVWVKGETRIAHVIVETDYKRHSHIMVGGFQVTPADLARFTSLYQEHLDEADWAVMAGSLPSGAPESYYHELVLLAHEHGTRALVDCPGEPARQAAMATPDVLKMNRAEFEATFEEPARPMQLLIEGMHRIRRKYALPAIVITCGEEGLLAVTPQKTYHALIPPQVEVNAAGSGDAASGCLAWQLSLGAGWIEALRQTAAVSAAVVLSEATAECRQEDIERLLPLAEVQEIPVSTDEGLSARPI